eukprot:606424-Rhodomonas_salina.1
MKLSYMLNDLDMDTMTLSLYQTLLMLRDAHNDAQLVSDTLDARRCSTMTFGYDTRLEDAYRHRAH